MAGRMVLTLAIVLASWGLMAFPMMAEADSTEASKPAPKVIMYVTSGCSYCAKARTWFDSREIQFDERNIDTSAEASREWQQLGGEGTPLIVINGNAILGFVQARVEAELAQLQ